MERMQPKSLKGRNLRCTIMLSAYWYYKVRIPSNLRKNMSQNSYCWSSLQSSTLLVPFPQFLAKRGSIPKCQTKNYRSCEHSITIYHPKTYYSITHYWYERLPRVLYNRTIGFILNNNGKPLEIVNGKQLDTSAIIRIMNQKQQIVCGQF